ncbi:Eco57I restriction-modification methylase domain-containing protein [Thermogemmatispora carboxidivorans]|uniref:Eco57I restriction-modification methylase domain-containing protein n=1 Tax=Thermogemmatispora carboxidivorans TaxID=1382306 RepID=UPI00069B09B5|nr:Eco57I restriction-modification methylase domain-containing protein [Thermogemmatispora carboxidivorans]
MVDAAGRERRRLTAALQLALPLVARAPQEGVGRSEPGPVTGERPLTTTGAVATRAAVVELMLDLAGYREAETLTDRLALEPAAGEGAFLLALARRLLASWQRQGRPACDLVPALLAYELDEGRASQARQALCQLLADYGFGAQEARRLAASWLRTGDFLVEAPSLPAADLVVGNPPYVRPEALPRERLTLYRSLYRTMRGRADLYVAFLEAALWRLKPGALCAFICPDRWLFNQYGAGLRRLVAEAFSLELVLEMHRAAPFAQAVTAYPAITLIRRARQGHLVLAQFSEEEPAASEEEAASRLRGLAGALEAVRQGQGVASALPAGLRATRLEMAGPLSAEVGVDWSGPVLAPERLALLRRLEERFPPLESEETGTTVGIGLATGLDEVFITSDQTLVEPSRLLPLPLRGDTANGVLRWSGHYLVNPWLPEGLVPLEDFPRLWAYFSRHAEALKRRYVARRSPQQWYRTIDRVQFGLIGRHKLYVPDIARRLEPVLDEGQTYPHHNLYVICSGSWDLEALGGLLLSDVALFFVACYGVRMRGGYYRFQAQYLRRIRLPRPAEVTPRQRQGLVTAFRQRDRRLATRIALELYGIKCLLMVD